jgi:hypothetical protein
MSLYDQDFWHNTDILINNLQRKNHGQTLWCIKVPQGNH